MVIICMTIMIITLLMKVIKLDTMANGLVSTIN
jgi:hypothetical protein